MHFSLDEAKRLHELLNGEITPCAEVRQILDTKILEIKDRMLNLKNVNAQLEQISSSCDCTDVDGENSNCIFMDRIMQLD